jgi:pimeloyl-ACP methyl ester carboxylesterase
MDTNPYHTPRADTARSRRSGARRAGVLALAVLAALLAWGALRVGARPPATPADAQGAAPAIAGDGDFAGLVDIGGRRLYLECRGQGSPTVVLEAGYRNHGGIWSIPSPGVTEPAVLPGVAAFTRVCAYHRPGAVVINEDDTVDRSRSDPVAEVRSMQEIVADLHALLRAAGVPGPYVLAGHSMGGAVMRLYAGDYPEEVVGLVLVDAAHEDLFVRNSALLPPELWAAIEQNYQSPLDGYPEFERVDLVAGLGHLRRARAETPLRPMPLAVLARGLPLVVPLPDFPIDATERVALALQEDLATLVPDARFFVASKSRHDIHQDQPALVTEAIRQVVAGVRHPDTWSELVACCGR